MIHSHRTGSPPNANPDRSGGSGPSSPATTVEQQHRLRRTAERERRRLVVPAHAVPRPEPRDRVPRVGRQPQEHPGRLRARQRGRQGQLDPGVPARVVQHLLHHGHPLRAHTHRGQHRVRAPGRRRPFGDPHQRLLARRGVPVVPARPEPGLQVPEQRLLELAPPGLPPPPVGPGPLQPGREPLHGVVQRPAERRLADHVRAVAGQASVHVGPAGHHRERSSALQDRDPVPFLEPERLQRVGLQRRPAGRMLGPRGGHQRRAPRVQPRLVGGLRRRPVVRDPRRGDRRRVVVQVGGRDQPVVLDGNLAATVRAEALQ